jgi:hypothetical protein
MDKGTDALAGTPKRDLVVESAAAGMPSTDGSWSRLGVTTRSP